MRKSSIYKCPKEEKVNNNQFIQGLKKWNFLDCPNKDALLFELLTIFCIYSWYIGIWPIRIFVGIFAVIRFIKPQLFPRLKLLSEGDHGERFNQWYQRMVALILLSISIDTMIFIGISFDIITSYRIRYSMIKLPILSLLICSMLEITCILWIVRFSTGQTRTARAFVLICIMIFFVLMIYFAIACWLPANYHDHPGSPYYLLKYRTNNRDIGIFKFAIPFFLLMIVLTVVTRSHQFEKQKGKIGRYLVLHILLPLVISIFAWITLGNYFASIKEKDVQRAWGNNFYPMEQAKTFFPDRKKNMSAEKLEEEALKLGIELERNSEIFSWKETKQSKEWADVHSDLRTYIYKQLEKPVMKVDAPSEKVTNFLTQHSATIDAIKEIIRAHGSPQWETKTKDSRCYFDIMELWSLQNILIAKTLVELNRAQQENALDAMETSWKINEAINEYPHTSYIFLGLTKKLQAGVLRKIKAVPDRWIERINQETIKMIVLKSIEKNFAESRNFERDSTDHIDFLNYFFEHEYSTQRNRMPFITFAYTDIIYDTLPKLFWKILTPVMNPYYRICCADYSHKTLQAILLYQKEDVCNYDFWEFLEQYKNSFASWNRIDEIIEPQHLGLPEPLLRVTLRNLDFGLTAEIIKIKKSIDSGSSASSLPFKSSVCKNAHWNYTIEKDNAWCIYFSKLPASYKNKQSLWLYLPLHFCSDKPLQ